MSFRLLYITKIHYVLFQQVIKSIKIFLYNNLIFSKLKYCFSISIDILNQMKKMPIHRWIKRLESFCNSISFFNYLYKF